MDNTDQPPGAQIAAPPEAKNPEPTIEKKKTNFKEKAMQAKDFGIKNAVYEKLMIIDILLCCFHLLFFVILSFNGFMWLTLLGIRGPRLVTHILAKKDTPEKLKYQRYEYLFRKYSTYGYLPVAWLLQLINCLAVYCRDYTGYRRMLQQTITVAVGRRNWNTGACKWGYMIWLTILLAANTAIDWYIWLKIVKPTLEPIVVQSGGTENKSAPTQSQAPKQDAYKDDNLGHDMA